MIRQQIRASVDIPFFDYSKSPDVSTEVLHHYINNYRNSSKIISSESKLSEDLLTLTTTMVWDKRDSFLQYICDPIIDEGFFGPGRKHNMLNNIKSTIVDARDF